jgi:hypothetical protein
VFAPANLSMLLADLGLNREADHQQFVLFG